MIERLHSTFEHRLFAVALFTVTLLSRLAFLFVTFPGDDHVAYFEDITIAMSLAQGDGYAMNFSGVEVTDTLCGRVPGFDWEPVPVHPTAVKLPAYPLLAAVVFWLFGVGNFLALFIVHAILAAGTAVLLFFAARSIHPIVGGIAGVLFAAYPPFLYHAVRTPESTTTNLFFVGLFFVTVLRHRSSPSLGRLCAAAASGGILVLAEAVAVPLVVGGLACAVLLSTLARPPRTPAASRRGVRWFGAQASLVVLVVGTIVAPWLYRNDQVIGAPVLRTGVAPPLLVTLRQAGVLTDDEWITIAGRAKGASELEEERLLEEGTKAWIRENRGTYWSLVPQNFLHYWWRTPKYEHDTSVAFWGGRQIPYTLLLLFSVPAILRRGLPFVRRPLRALEEHLFWALALLLIASYTAVYTLFGVLNLRYHFAVELVLLVFAADSVRAVIASATPSSSR